MAIRSVCSAFVVLFILVASPISADMISASATITGTPNGSNYDYTVTLNNTGATTIGTYWFAWVPGEDFMTSSPLSVTNPAGWTDNITHGGSNDGYAIQWLATSSTSYLAIGGSLQFSFESTETPAQLAGDSVFYSTTATTLSYVYSGAPFSDQGFKFVPTPAAATVPEPASLLLASIAATFGFAYLRRNSSVFRLRRSVPQSTGKSSFFQL